MPRRFADGWLDGWMVEQLDGCFFARRKEAFLSLYIYFRVSMPQYTYFYLLSKIQSIYSTGFKTS